MCSAPQRHALFRHLNFFGSGMVCFVHFDLEMCFAPQRRALFRHRNFQKWCENVVFCTFWVGNVFHATTARTFSTFQLPKVVRTWGLLLAFWLGNVFRATTVCNFSMSQLLKLLRSWSFCTFWLGNALRAKIAWNLSFLIWPDGSAPAALVRLLFDPLEPQIIGKNTVNRDFPAFSRTCIFFLLTFSPLWSSHFFSSPLWLFPPLLFPSIHIVGSLISKLLSYTWGFPNMCGYPSWMVYSGKPRCKMDDLGVPPFLGNHNKGDGYPPVVLPSKYTIEGF